MLRFLSTALALCIAASCTPPRSEPVELEYAFSEHARSSYRLRARARANWDIGARGAGSYEATYTVVEEVQSVDESGAVLSVTMTAEEIVERNLPAPGRDRTAFRLRLGRDGAVREVLGIEDVAAAALDPDELVFIGTFRPPLPGRPVHPGDDWEAAAPAGLGAVFRQIVTRGTLEALQREGSTTFASLEYSGEAPLVWTTSLPYGLAELSGSADTRGEALFDVDHGRLEEARSSTEGSFDVRVVPRGARPAATGTLQLRLDLELRRLPD